ncbi:hypothetical protein FQN49_000752 [Arthroderma sp. PD_2]|nr:hypothetical protein FQN49_000752 [Arthroderma sp. PD_2]
MQLPHWPPVNDRKCVNSMDDYTWIPTLLHTQTLAGRTAYGILDYTATGELASLSPYIFHFTIIPMAIFDATATSEQVVEAFTPQVKGRTFVITGAGQPSIGSSMATLLAKASPKHVLIASRTAARVEPVISAIREIDPLVKTTFVQIDLSDHNSVRQAAGKILLATSSEIDVLINSAGNMAIQDYTVDKQGIEMQLSANHLGHFLLTNLLMPALLTAAKKEQGVRIVNLTSLGHRISAFRFDDFNFSDGDTYDPWTGYGQAKTANILFSYGLNKRLTKHGITSFSAHPGANVDTRLGSHLTMEDFGSILPIAKRNTGNDIEFDNPRFKTYDQIGATPLIAALDPDISTEISAYLTNSRVEDPDEHTRNPRMLKSCGNGSGTSFNSLHGGSGFAQTGHLKALVPSTDKDGKDVEVEKHFFVKISSPVASSSFDGDNLPEDAAMFRGEFTSLNAIVGIVQDICPKAIAWGQVKDDAEPEGLSLARKTDTSSWFLVTQFLQLGGIGRQPASGPNSLAERLGKLHSIPAPPPPTAEESEQAAKTNLRLNGPEGNGEDEVPQFGFPVPTFCGNVKQPNQFRRSWADFYANQRLRTVLAEAEKRNRKDKALRELVERTADEVVPRLLADGHLGFNKEGNGKPVIPVIVHGDLWSGNTDVGKVCRVSRGQDGYEEDEEDVAGDVVYDPSSCYAHSEFELGIMQMFGGFSRRFYMDYHRIVPKTEPVEEYEDRVDLYELYHQLNHYAIFGGGYGSSAMSTMRRLLKKYGN